MDNENKYKILKVGLAVDIDETLSWTIGHWVEKMMAKFGNPENLSVKEIIEKYRYTQNVPYWQSQEALAWMMAKVNSNDVQKELPLIEEASICLERINKLIPIAAYLTIRPETVLAGTKHWLDKHNFPVAPIICRPITVDHNDGNKWKAGVLEKLYPQVAGIIDDNPKLLNFLSADYRGKIFLYDHHDNFGRTNVIPCRNWLEVYKNIKNVFSNFNL
ncbi:MAG: hypothetical protein NTX66_01210 [Candidatus Falkowbacteria bacterium]|nr:hypothetical protein [Candidatus Falkowbacteria bacterium]